MTALIIGASGFVGAELIRQAREAGHRTAATYATKPGDACHAVWFSLDLRDTRRLDAVMAEVRPQLVVNASSGKADWTVTAEALSGSPGPRRSTEAAWSTCPATWSSPSPLRRDQPP